MNTTSNNLDQKAKCRTLKDKDLLTQTELLVSQERHLTSQVLYYLEEIARRRLFASLGYSSLFSYCTEHLKYSHSQAQRRIEAMRLSSQLPEIKTKVATGQLNLTNVAAAAVVFRQQSLVQPLSKETKQEIMSKIENKSTREAEKVLLQSFGANKLVPPERMRQVTQSHVQISFSASESLLAKLERLKGLLVHQTSTNSWAEVIEKISDIVLEKIDPLEKAKRFEKRKQARPTPASSGVSQVPALSIATKVAASTTVEAAAKTSSSKSTKSVSLGKSAGSMNFSKSVTAPLLAAHQSSARVRQIPSGIRHQVWLRDKGCCSYKDSKTGQVCGSTHGLAYYYPQVKAVEIFSNLL